MGLSIYKFRGVIKLRLQPDWTEKGADCTVLPVLSRSARLRLVPEAKVTEGQLNELPVRFPQVMRAGSLGVAPG